MILKQRLFTNMFLRNMLADFGNRSANSTNGKPTPYFQYRIGNYQPDYYLYFPKEPFTIQYKNEAFNKLQEYNGYDVINYLDFHYAHFGDKTDFLRFIQYEVSDRLKRKLRVPFRQKLQCAREWLAEKQKELLTSHETKLKGKIEQGVKEIFVDGKPGASQKDIETAASALSKNLSDHIEQIMASTEERMETLTSSFVTGHIEINNHNHLDKVIQLLILLQMVQAPGKYSKQNNSSKNSLQPISPLFCTYILELLRIKRSIHFSKDQGSKRTVKPK